jgi:hypothetical protein
MIVGGTLTAFDEPSRILRHLESLFPQKLPTVLMAGPESPFTNPGVLPSDA